MRTADLTKALLDYWTARAERVPAADLEFRANGTLCVRRLRNGPHGIDGVMVLDYSTNWALTGPLVDGRRLDIMCIPTEGWAAYIGSYPVWGDTAMIAICRAVVRAAFGDEVEDLP